MPLIHLRVHSIAPGINATRSTTSLLAPVPYEVVDRHEGRVDDDTAFSKAKPKDAILLTRVGCE